MDMPWTVEEVLKSRDSESEVPLEYPKLILVAFESSVLFLMLMLVVSEELPELESFVFRPKYMPLSESPIFFSMVSLYTADSVLAPCPSFCVSSANRVVLGRFRIFISQLRPYLVDSLSVDDVEVPEENSFSEV